VLILRKIKPEWDRPTKVSLFFPLSYVILTFVVIGFAIQDSYRDFGISILMLCISVPLYLLKNYFQSKKKTAYGCGYKVKRVFVKVVRFLQKLFLIASPATKDVPLAPVPHYTAASPIIDVSSYNPAKLFKKCVKIGMKNNSRPNYQNSHHQSLEIQSKELLNDTEKCTKESVGKNQIHNVKIDQSFKKYESKFKN